MKKVLYVLFVFSFISKAQDLALVNYGDMQIHENGKMGFHTNLINNGNFNKNKGVAGFYNTDKALAISGNKAPQFFDMEVGVSDNLFLNISTEITNALVFIDGKIITPRTTPEIAVNFLQTAKPFLHNDDNHIDGYASYEGNLDFEFPIGDNHKIKPLEITRQDNISKVYAAYFEESPDNPSTFPNSFDTAQIGPDLAMINYVGFWHVDGTDTAAVKLNWDSDNFYEELCCGLEKLKVAGWHKPDEEWKNLGGLDVSTTHSSGNITSEVFNLSNYNILTLGSTITNNVEDLSFNNLVSPNGDGINDYFTIDNIESYQNTLEIYNRWGKLVYKTENYNNNWNGRTNQEDLFINEKRALPTGTYFYVLRLTDINKTATGWLYIAE